MWDHHHHHRRRRRYHYHHMSGKINKQKRHLTVEQACYGLPWDVRDQRDPGTVPEKRYRSRPQRGFVVFDCDQSFVCVR